MSNSTMSLGHQSHLLGDLLSNEKEDTTTDVG
jgi:hypothetical protein